MPNFKLKPYVERLEAGEKLETLCDELRALSLSDEERSVYIDRLFRVAELQAEARNAPPAALQINFANLIMGFVLLGLALVIHFALQVRGFIGVLPFLLGGIGIAMMATAFRRED